MKKCAFRSLLVCVSLVLAAPAAAQPLRVCTTTPDLGSLVREVGGNLVGLDIFAKPTEDPHFIEAKPSFVKALSQADVFVQVGMELEMAWAPALLRNARNARILSGQPGYIDASTVIRPLETPAGSVDRSMGDVHALGNPHYLTDPLNGLRVAALLAERFTALRPEEGAAFERNLVDFRTRVGTALVGAKLAEKYDFEKLALLFERDRLLDFLEQQGEASLLGGWLGSMTGLQGTKVVADHNLWPYFARRFRINVIGFMEPKPGISPTTKHLAKLVERMQSTGVHLVLAAPYYDPRHAEFLSRHTGARIVEMTPAVGGRSDTQDYVAMVGHNVETLAALAASEGGSEK